MNNTAQIALILCFSIVITSFAGCIERHSEKTETIITKFDRNSNTQWKTVIANANYSSANSAIISNRIIQTSDNGYLLAGRFSEKFTGKDNFRLIKTDRGGNLLWEKRIPINTADLELFTIIERSDNGYSIISRHGNVYLFDAAGILEGIQGISKQINDGFKNKTAGEEYPPVTIRSLTQTIDGNMILVIDNYAKILEPVTVAGLSLNGTILWKKTPNQTIIGGTTDLIQTQDGGYLLGKSHFVSQSNMTKILIGKTDRNFSFIWTSSVGLCNYSYCDNTVLGMHESADRVFEIVYQSFKLNNSISDPDYSLIFTASLDNEGTIVRQDRTNVMELPNWLFYQDNIPPELVNRIDRNLKSFISKPGDQTPSIFHPDSLIKTDDGGYVVVETAYYF